MNSTPQITVVQGKRNYFASTWKRVDTIYLDGKKIGHVRSTRVERPGKTISTITNQSKNGRDIQWCVDQALHHLSANNANDLPYRAAQSSSDACAVLQ